SGLEVAQQGAFLGVPALRAVPAHGPGSARSETGQQARLARPRGSDDEPEAMAPYRIQARIETLKGHRGGMGYPDLGGDYRAFSVSVNPVHGSVARTPSPGVRRHLRAVGAQSP